MHSLKVLSNEGALVFFPEGTRAPADGYLKAKLGIGWVISLTGATVLPVYVHGSTAKPFVWRGRPHVSITFGRPVPAGELVTTELRGKELYQQIADRVLETIRELSLHEPRGRVKTKGPVYDRNTIEDKRLR